MSGKKGRSGRIPVKYQENLIQINRVIAAKSNQLLVEYLDHIQTLAVKDRTDKHHQNIVTLSMKHSPEVKGDSGTSAADILKEMAISGMKEYARLKANSAAEVNNEVVQDIIVVNPDDAA